MIFISFPLSLLEANEFGKSAWHAVDEKQWTVTPAFSSHIMRWRTFYEVVTSSFIAVSRYCNIKRNSSPSKSCSSVKNHLHEWCPNHITQCRYIKKKWWKILVSHVICGNPSIFAWIPHHLERYEAAKFPNEHPNSLKWTNVALNNWTTLNFQLNRTLTAHWTMRRDNKMHWT